MHSGFLYNWLPNPHSLLMSKAKSLLFMCAQTDVTISPHNHPDKDGSIQRSQAAPLLLSHQKNLDYPLSTVQTANQSSLPWLSTHPSFHPEVLRNPAHKQTEPPRRDEKPPWGLMFLYGHTHTFKHELYDSMKFNLISGRSRKANVFCLAQSWFDLISVTSGLLPLERLTITSHLFYNSNK